MTDRDPPCMNPKRCEKLKVCIGSDRKIAFTLAFAAACLMAASCREADDCPAYPEDIKGLVTEYFEKDTLVRDAGIFQDGCDLDLVLVVSPATSEAYAKELGDQFVRMTIGLGENTDTDLGKQIGESVYHYLVGVYTWPSEENIAMGAKAAKARRLIW